MQEIRPPVKIPPIKPALPARQAVLPPKRAFWPALLKSIKLKQVLIIAGALALLFWFYRLYAANSELRAQLEQSQKQQMGKPADDSAKLISQVSRLIVLPENEQPTTATVTDLAKLKDQPFFARAELGDKVLIYGQSKKAILYRPSADKIIEVAPFNPTSQ